MTKEEREEAIYQLERCIHNAKVSGNKYSHFELAIEALKVEPCEDAISRQAAIDAVAFGITYAKGVNMETGEVTYPFAESNQELRKAIHRICELPPVNPQPKTGHWINGDCKGGNCSICGEYYAFYPESGDFNYCPNCGAKMVEQESEDKE